MMAKIDSLSAVETRDVIERTWEDVSELKNQCFLLMDGLTTMLSMSNAGRNDGFLALTVLEDRVSSMLWLSGEALSLSHKIDNRFNELFDEVEP